jgi:hypothetical protein
LLALFSSSPARNLFDFSTSTNQLDLLQQKSADGSPTTSRTSKDFQKELPTKIVPGQMTEKQKTHSQLYDKDYDLPQRLDLHDPKNKNQAEGLTTIGTPMVAYSDTDPQPTATDAFRRLSCSADAIVVGTVSGKTSQLMNSRQFVFTEYDFFVNEVLKDNQAAPIVLNQPITVVRPGGTVEIDGRIVRAVDDSFRPLTTDNSYLLFLKYLPKTKSYDSAILRGSFKVKDNQLNKLTGGWIPGFDSEDAGPSIESIRTITGSSCSK